MELCLFRPVINEGDAEAGTSRFVPGTDTTRLRERSAEVAKMGAQNPA